MEQVALTQLNAIEQALAKARSINDVVNLRNQAEAARQCFRLAEYGLEMQNNAAEVKLRAERRAGEMLAEMDKAPAGRPSKNRLQSATDLPPTYDELGIEKTQAHRWQLEASVPPGTFEQHIAETKAAGEELTSAGVIRLAKRIIQQAEREETQGNILTPIEANRKYHAIVIDPPWPVQKIVREVRPNQDRFAYRTMTLDEIAKLPIADLANDEGCHVYLWVTQKYLPAGLALFEQWGVKYQCVMTWVKPTGMTPFSWMYNTEHVLFGQIGNLRLARMGLKLSFEAPVTKHSEKPEVFYERVRQASPNPRLDMFARVTHDGFDAWGDEAHGGRLGKK